MDAHPPGAEMRRRSLHYLTCLFIPASIMPDFFVTFPLFARSSPACATGGAQMNAGAAQLRQTTDEEISR